MDDTLSGPWFRPLEFIGLLCGIALWAFSGCAAKKADIPPPTPAPQVPPPAQAPVAPSPAPLPVPGKSPAERTVHPAGPGQPAGGVTSQPTQDYRSGPMLKHKVRYPGESVSIIAGWYTGEIENWKILAEVNPDINPNVIYEGMTINIPESLLKTREPMTREYVDGFYPKSRSKSKSTGSRGQTKAPADEEPALFGPKH